MTTTKKLAHAIGIGRADSNLRHHPGPREAHHVWSAAKADLAKALDVNIPAAMITTNALEWEPSEETFYLELSLTRRLAYGTDAPPDIRPIRVTLAQTVKFDLSDQGGPLYPQVVAAVEAWNTMEREADRIAIYYRDVAIPNRTS